MNNRIVWKEARSHRDTNNQVEDDDDHQNDNDSNESDQADSCVEETIWSESDRTSLPDRSRCRDVDAADVDDNVATNVREHVPIGFSHRQINLSLRRNITKLADPAQHKPKPEYVVEGQVSQSFDQWLERALVAISPTADIILFSSQYPTNTVFVAKLRKEPVNQYTSKDLDVPLDYDERVTSLLCLPIMATQRTSMGLVDWTALVLGLSSGYVKFYTDQSICLLSLKFCDEPVVSIKLQTQKVNTNARSQAHFATIVDELFIVYRSCAIVIDGIGLHENLRISKEDVVKNKLNYEPAYNITNLPTILTCQRWKFEAARDSKVLDADLLGMRCTTRFDTLKSNSINYDHIPSKTCTRALVLVGSNPFLTCYREAKDTVSHSYTEMIGSLLPFWSKPEPSRVQVNEVSCSSSLAMFDKGRLANSIIASPDRRLAAMTDDFGRVMLVDITNWLIIRIWKGYRNAQCGWVEVKRDPEEPGTPYASFLVIYAPKRGLLEVWSAQRGLRVAAFNVGKSCRLLYVGHKMLNMRAESLNKPKATNLLTDQSYSNNCYLLNAKSEMLFAIELPYTYSLYKYSDLKSRDRLLINELSGAIQQDGEVSSISEIVQRMALADSLQVSIHKIAMNLLPDKIVPIMESLINKIMKDYDNHAGESMSKDDLSIVELCKRIVRLCSTFDELIKSDSSDITLLEVNQRLIDQHDEHPKEVDNFAAQLGWDASEVLRYLSLMALERSFRMKPAQNPWPNMGEPLTWAEFVGCFDLKRTDYRLNKRTPKTNSNHQPNDKIAIKLRELSSKFLKEDRLIKTSVLMYNRLSEHYYRLSANSPELAISELSKDFNKCQAQLDPTSRLILLFQFWLSTKLCDHWKMWAFLQQQVGIISDELRVVAMTMDNSELLVESWKKVYNLILESDNIYAAIIATAAIRSDTLRMISDNEKREKLDRADDESTGATHQDASDQKGPSIDWEYLCVDAERMAIFSQQLEDVFLLGLLLRYSPTDGRLVDNFVYRVPRISVANIIRSRRTVISELVAQWAVQTDIELKIFTQPYGADRNEQDADKLVIDSRERRSLSPKFSSTPDSDEHTRELLHHVKTSFPHSLDPDVLLLNCIWESCSRWAGSQTAREKARLLDKAFDCLSLLSDISIKHNSASWAYKAFFQPTFERLAILIETNSTIMSPKCLRSRDTLSRRELRMGESCLEDFVSFCYKLSDFMLATCRQDAVAENELQPSAGNGDKLELRQRLMAIDDWWSTPSVVKMMGEPDCLQQPQLQTELGHNAAKYGPENSNIGVSGGSGEGSLPANSLRENESVIDSLVSASLSSVKLFDVNTLVELSRLTTLMLLIFKLRIIKTYPLSIIGDKSRETLKLDLQQSPSTGADMKTRSGLLNELRHKFARKCIVSIVAKITQETNESDGDGSDGICFEDNKSDRSVSNRDSEEDIDTDNDKKHLKSVGINKAKSKQWRPRQSRDKQITSGSDAVVAATGSTSVANCQRESYLANAVQKANNESMALFTHLLSLTCEWQIDSDELHLELVFELYRCNHDKLAAQVTNRTRDKQTLANGLLKISSQRVLVLFGLSPQLSSSVQWQKRVDKWSLFQPNVASWLKSIQEEEANHEIGLLHFAEPLRQARRWSRKRIGNDEPDDDDDDDDDDDSARIEDFDFYIEQSLGLRLHALSALCHRTKSVLETVTNYLDGQANRLAYDLLQLLELGAPAKFLAIEKELWSRQREKMIAKSQSVAEG